MREMFIAPLGQSLKKATKITRHMKRLVLHNLVINAVHLASVTLWFA